MKKKRFQSCDLHQIQQRLEVWLYLYVTVRIGYQSIGVHWFVKIWLEFSKELRFEIISDSQWVSNCDDFPFNSVNSFLKLGHRVAIGSFNSLTKQKKCL